MLSAEAGATFPYNSYRYGDHKPRRQIATVEEYPTEAVATVEGEADILDECDFSTLDEHTIAALYEEMVQDDLALGENYEEDFPDGQ